MNFKSDIISKIIIFVLCLIIVLQICDFYFVVGFFDWLSYLFWLIVSFALGIEFDERFIKK